MLMWCFNYTIYCISCKCILFQHEGICEFPSQQFYNGHLKTKAKRRASVLLKQAAIVTPILFGHVAGTEISLVVSTEWGNENSMANVEEAKQAVNQNYQTICVSLCVTN